MTGLTRHKGLKPGGPLRPMSAKRLAELGGFALSTFAPKLARTPSLASGTSGVEESTGRDGSGRGGRPARGHRSPAVPPQQRKSLAGRSDGWCEIQLDGCHGRAVHPHHRITTKSGGRHGEAKVDHDRLSDLLHLCWYCHDEVTCWPQWAKRWDHGWALNENDEPTQHPVLRRGEFGYLTDDGRFVPYEEACA